ncbi:MAG: PepSY domain-containing protein [Steroidobacteraceae bacterium]
MKTVRSVGVAAVALALCAGPLLAGAQAAPPAVSRVAAPPPHAKVSMDKAVRLAQRRFRARVVRAETQTDGDRTIYVLRMLDGNGRVFAVRVDAASGDIL